MDKLNLGESPIFKCTLCPRVNQQLLYVMEEPCIRRDLHKDGAGGVVEPEWVSAVLRQPINQPFEHLSPPLPVSALRSTAAARSPQEATG